MVFDPRTLTPAAVKSMMMPQQQPPLAQRVAQNVAQPVTSLEQLLQGQQPSAPPEPQVGPTRDAAANLEGIVSNLTNAQAKDIGEEVFGPALANADPEKLITAATDNVDDVDPSIRPLYEANPELIKILGASTKLAAEETATSNLLSTIISDETTPDEARKEVAKFFGTDPDKDTPAWADVAISVGLSLLRGEGKRAPGESDLSGFLKDVGVAGERGFAVAKQRRKEKSARSNMLDKLAYGVYREDKKQRTALAAQLRTNLSKIRQDNRAFALDMGKYLQKADEMDATQSKNVATAITQTLNTLSEDQKAKAFPIIAQNADAFRGVRPENIASTMFGLFKTKGLDLANIADAKNIVESSFVITDKTTYDQYKTAFPKLFPENFQEGREYKVEGFSDKSKGGAESGLALTNVLSVQKSIGGSDELTRLLTRIKDLDTAILNETDQNKKAEFEKEKVPLLGRLELLTERKDPVSYVLIDGQMVASGEGAAGAYQAAEAARIGADLSRKGNALASAFSLADGLNRSLATTPTPAAATGVLAQFGNFASGFTQQFQAIGNTFGDRSSDNAAAYFGGTITDAMKNSKDRALSTSKYGDTLGDNKYTVGQVFSAFEEATKANTQLRSQIMSFAYALAGSRETGKLTDKDVAAALVTFGGGDIADGKWFANPDVLVAGINQALTTATNDYAILYNNVHGSAKNKKYLKDFEKLNDDDIAKRTSFDLNSFLQKNEGVNEGLAGRVTNNAGQIIMQSLDKYRGDGAGNVETGPRLSSGALNYIGVLNDAAERSKLDSSDPMFISPADLDIIVRSIPPKILEEIREYRKGNQ